jgi:hypothetical protein
MIQALPLLPNATHRMFPAYERQGGCMILTFSPSKKKGRRMRAASNQLTAKHLFELRVNTAVAEISVGESDIVLSTVPNDNTDRRRQMKA